ncbi:arylesterase [Salisaeta longa]|uniref:arylesterase n=1 Tax=Salisaeta longa TaxID=503170 RepID=UPI00048B4CCD|nr:arylesterase [Salisaeta longa]
MIPRALYLCIAVTVLALAGCGLDRSNPSSTNDTTTRATEGAPSSPSTAASSPVQQPRPPADSSALQVLVLGNSIAAGYGLPRPSEQSFPARLQQRVDSLGWDVTIRNAGLSGETTAGGLRRIGWLLKKPVDVLLLELGGNDGLRGVDLTSTKENLRAIIDTTRAAYPDARVLLAGMQIPPNLGPSYTQRFKALYPEVAASRKGVTLIPFILKGVGGVDAYMQPDGIHPNAAGHRRIANTVWPYLRPVLQELRAQPTPA